LITISEDAIWGWPWAPHSGMRPIIEVQFAIFPRLLNQV